MSATQIHLPRHSVSPRHLYRHLLREASYLPPICASYVSARIKQQFRAHMLEDLRAQDHITKGRRQLRQLQAANSGDRKQMHNVLLRTFGRKGELRRALFSRLVQPGFLASPTPTGPETAALKKKHDPLARVREVYDRARMDTKYKKNFLNRWDMVSLQAFMRTQAAQFEATCPRVWCKPPFSKREPTSGLPKENIWGRPLPLRELRSRLKSWWLSNADKVMPPTGAGEWNTLRSIAVSSEIGPLLQIPPRRPVAVPVASAHNEEMPKLSWSYLQPYASMPVSRIERERRQGFKTSARGLPYEPQPTKPKRVSNRRLRRLCGWIFESSPVLTGRPGDAIKDRVKWGQLTPDLPVASPELSSFFQDVEADGGKLTGAHASRGLQPLHERTIPSRLKLLPLPPY